MRVLMLSKACIVGQYQSKLEALAKHDDIELTVMVPPAWKDERGILRLERVHTDGYALEVSPIALNGHFHLHFYPALSRVMSQVKPDIVHIDEEPYNLATFLATREARQSGSVPVFFTWQNIARRYPPPFAWFESYTLASCQQAIAGNKEAVGVLRGKNFKGGISVIPQFGIDPSVYAPTGRLRPNGTDIEIGFVGRFVKEKGPDLLLRALATISGNWHLTMLGSGPMRDNLVSLVSELGLSSRVKIEPWRPSTEMPAFYQALDLIVVPSITRANWKEQFGRVLIEAMACEVPVIGSSCGEIPNVIGNAGILFKEGDVEALYTAIQELMQNPSRCLELQELGRERVQSHFTQTSVADRTYKVYIETARSPSALLSDVMRI